MEEIEYEGEICFQNVRKIYPINFNLFLIVLFFRLNTYSVLQLYKSVNLMPVACVSSLTSNVNTLVISGEVTSKQSTLKRLPTKLVFTKSLAFLLKWYFQHWKLKEIKQTWPLTHNWIQVLVWIYYPSRIW